MIVIVVVTFIPSSTLIANALSSIPRGMNGNWEIYVMDADGQNQQNLTKNPYNDAAPEWFGPAFVVAPTRKKLMMWGWLK